MWPTHAIEWQTILTIDPETNRANPVTERTAPRVLAIRLPGQEPRVIWSLNQNPRYVTADEFASLMTPPPR